MLKAFLQWSGLIKSGTEERSIWRVCQGHFLPGTAVLYGLALGFDWHAYHNPRESKIRLPLVQLKWNQLSSIAGQIQSNLLNLLWIHTRGEKREDFSTEFLWFETAITLWSPLSMEGKPHLRVSMVSLCNIPCPAFSLIAELFLFYSNNFEFFSYKSMWKKKKKELFILLPSL